MLDWAVADNAALILAIDAPLHDNDCFSPEEISSLRQRKRLHYPGICIIQLAEPGHDGFALQSYADGVRAVIPRPSLSQRRKTYVPDTIRFLKAFQSYLSATVTESH